MEISKEKLFRIFIKSCPKELSKSFIIIDPENTFQWLMLFNCFSATSGCINLPSSTRISAVCGLSLNISLSFSWISASSSPVLVWLSRDKNQGVNFRGETLHHDYYMVFKVFFLLILDIVISFEPLNRDH